MYCYKGLVCWGGITMSHVLDYYNHLHTIPELGFEEVKTSKFIAEKLAEFGYTNIQTGVGGTTGVVATMDSGEPGPTVLLRADMDCLAHNIDGEVVLRHTCGHDGHSSMLLATAEEVIKYYPVSSGKLIFLFQPAEELGTGAHAIADAGVLEGVEYAFGAHVRPIEEASNGQAVAAIYYASSATIQATFTGVTSHAARPHLGVNALDAAVLAINAVNTIHLRPTESYSVKATQFHADSGVTNSIPGKAFVTWDLRAQLNPTMKELHEKVITAITNAGQANGCTVEYDDSKMLTAAEHNEECIDLLKEAISEVLGDENMVPEVITPGGEDFWVYTNRYPNLKAGFFGLGCDLKPGLHHPDMSFDTSALENGVKIYLTVLKNLGMID